MSEDLKSIIVAKKRGFPSKAPDDITLMKEYSKLKAKEIAKNYGVTESTVRAWIRGARKRLKEGGFND